MASDGPVRRNAAAPGPRVRPSAAVAAGLALGLATTALAADRPEYIEIPAAPTASLSTAEREPSPSGYVHWARSHGDAGSRRYSALDQIHRGNVGRLRRAWVYRSGDGPGNIQCNPIIVGGVMFAPTPGGALVALDAASGRELWRHVFELPEPRGFADAPARRGLVHWAGDARTPPRLFVGCGKWVYALDPATGRRVEEFGAAGRAPMPQGATAAGVVFRDVLVMPGLEGDIYGFDVRSGATRWVFHTIPQPGEFGADTWEGADKDGAHCWGGLSLDEQSGLVFAAIGAPRPDFIGVGRKGDNLFSNCVVALDALTGERKWHFQNVRHDLWDLDNPAPPNLVVVERDGRKVAAVACVTKTGTTLLLDRTTGAPIFPFRLRRAPASSLSGEVTAEYQPDPELPEPFSRPDFRMSDITDISPEATAFVRAQVDRANYGWFVPFTEGKPTLFRSSRGGAQWTGAAVDPQRGLLYVNSNHLLSAITVIRNDELERDPRHPPSAGEKTYQQWCVTCHGPTRRGVGMAPSLLGLRHRLTDAETITVITSGRGGMPPMPMIPASEIPALTDFLMRRNQPPPVKPGPASSIASRHSDHIASGYLFVRDAEGYPGVKPPWGTLTCLDLNTGKIRWQVPLGHYEELLRRGIPPTGTENFGGPTLTAGGLVFCAGTPDNLIRAFDAADGRELWSAPLPWGGYAPPAVYAVNGRQYIVIAATGGGKLGGETGDAYVAFALPDE